MHRTAGLGALAAALLAACGGGGGGGGGGGTTNDSALVTALQGGWTRCRLQQGGRPLGEALTFTGNDVLVTYDEYADARGCFGEATRIGTPLRGPFLIGAPVEVTLFGQPATAHEFDYLRTPTEWVHDIILLDPRSPYEFFTGDMAAEAGRDGTASDRHPRVLLITTRFAKNH